MSNFDERSGIVPCKTAWGSWSQTMEEVSLLVDVPAGTRSRDVRCTIQPRSIALSVGGTDVLKVPMNSLNVYILIQETLLSGQVKIPFFLVTYLYTLLCIFFGFALPNSISRW